MISYKEYSRFLAGWIRDAQQHLYVIPERPELMCYGPGYNSWGVQTNQKAFSAFAVAAVDPSINWDLEGIEKQKVLDQALAMLRFSLESHIEGSSCCTDGEKWGHTWISALGIERMMHAVEAVWDYLTEEDHKLLRKVLISEVDWLLNEYEIVAGLIENNKPESNIWNGAILSRTALYYPDAPNAERYKEKATEFFINGISIEDDVNNEKVYDGKKVKDAFVGANFFNSFACNHHRYMNVGYMVICLSNIAMLHFSLKARRAKAPEALYHNVYDLWKLIRSCTFEDGRLWRIGGDTRVRYSYCQDYALPMWALMQDKYDEDCTGFEKGWLEILKTETVYNGDGSFLSSRIDYLKDLSPLYYTRLESDRANVISMMAYWRRMYDLSGSKKCEEITSWYDSYHGSVMEKGKNRLASFTWISAERPQAMCLKRGISSLAEWRYNLTGAIRGIGVIHDCRVLSHEEKLFEGGFITYGKVMSESQGFVSEGQNIDRQAVKMIAFAALPDDATVISIQKAVAANRTLIDSYKGILWNIPNDIFNGTVRRYKYDGGSAILKGAEKTDGKNRKAGKWLNVDDAIGIAVSGDLELTMIRPEKRQIEIKRHLGKDSTDYGRGSLYCDEIAAPYSNERKWYDRGEKVYEVSFAMVAGDAQKTKQCAESMGEIENLPEEVLSISVTGQNGREYFMLYNTSDACLEVEIPDAVCISDDFEKRIGAGQALLFERSTK
ncbi:MAG: hypothetical protein ACOX22_02450 [Caldicoprobacterales bacterium]|jgi:hypothetical protein